MGADIEPQVLEKDFIEIKEQFLEAEKIKGLGWTCNYDLRKGIRASIPWYKEYHQNPTQFYWAT